MLGILRKRKHNEPLSIGEKQLFAAQAILKRGQTRKPLAPVITSNDENKKTTRPRKKLKAVKHTQAAEQLRIPENPPIQTPAAVAPTGAATYAAAQPSKQSVIPETPPEPLPNVANSNSNLSSARTLFFTVARDIKPEPLNAIYEELRAAQRKFEELFIASTKTNITDLAEKCDAKQGLLENGDEEKFDLMPHVEYLEAIVTLAQAERTISENLTKLRATLNELATHIQAISELTKNPAIGVLTTKIPGWAKTITELDNLRNECRTQIYVHVSHLTKTLIETETLILFRQLTAAYGNLINWYSPWLAVLASSSSSNSNFYDESAEMYTACNANLLAEAHKCLQAKTKPVARPLSPEPPPSPPLLAIESGKFLPALRA